MPTWRLVVAEATPACAGRIPASAVLAMGGLTGEPAAETA
jgi:hypothetical protein